jgi:hypothetical protein
MKRSLRWLLLALCGALLLGGCSKPAPDPGPTVEPPAGSGEARDRDAKASSGQPAGASGGVDGATH